MDIPEKIRTAAREAERALAGEFERIDEISRTCTERVMDAFRENRVSEAMFAPSTGYGFTHYAMREFFAVGAGLIKGELSF